MKLLKRLLCAWLVISFYFCNDLSGQNLGWHSAISSVPLTTDQTNQLNCGSLGMAQIRHAAIGPGGRIFSTGYFSSLKSQFGNTTLYSDTLLGTGSDGGLLFSAFVACQDSQGTFLWAKRLSAGINKWLAGVAQSNTGQFIATDSQGNVYVAGSQQSDSLVILNQRVIASSDYKSYLYLAKLNSSGNLIWIRSFSSSFNFGSPSIGMGWRNLQIRDNKIEGLLVHNGVDYEGTALFPASNIGLGHGRVSFSESGQFLSGHNFLFSEPQVSKSEVTLSRFLPNGKLLISNTVHDSQETRGTYISLLDTLMQTEKRIWIKSYHSSRPDISASWIFPREIIPLEDGGYGLFMSFGETIEGERKLILNADTLTLPPYLLVDNNPTRTVFIRLSPDLCMNRVQVDKRPSDGIMMRTESGNYLSVQMQEGMWGYNGPVQTTATILLYNVNGTVTDSLPTGLPVSFLPDYPNELYNIRMPSYQFLQLNGKPLCVVGSRILQLNLPATSSADSSFAGCLSDRNILLAKHRVEPQETISIAGNPVSDYLCFARPLPAGSQWEIVNTLGQRMESVASSSSEKLFVGNLPSGIYQIFINGKTGTPVPIRFQKY